MIPLALAWLAAAALGAQTRHDSLVVRSADWRIPVPIVETGAGPAVRVDLVAAALDGRVRRLATGEYVVTLPGVEFDVTEHVPFARVGTAVHPLSVAPYVADRRLYVPLQLVADLLPRLGSGVMYDPAHSELRLFSTVARRARPAAPAAPPTAEPALATVPDPVPVEPQPTTRAEPDRPRGIAGEGPSDRSTADRPVRRGHRRLVVVDAGHGGPDNGMTGPIGAPRKIYEKDITLAVARKLTSELRARGVDVLMTRSTDTLIALGDRGRIANRSKADLFLSIHVNAANLAWRDPAAARGFETYFLAEAKTEDESRVERMENEAVRFETGVNAAKGDPLSFILNDMAQNEHLRESNDLAETIQRSLRQMHPGPSRGVKQANFAVLRTSFMPAVLVEIGFGTNAAEARFISDPSRQAEIAVSIADAATEYLSHYERRVAGAGR
jgi:N-acetylmuramoyl-L-alanine amidase